jgi:carboxyl-terminal processing protease
MKIFRFFSILFLLSSTLLSACAAETPTQLSPAMGSILSQDIENAFQWLQANALMAKNVDWTALRAEAAALKPDLNTSADTYPILCKALRELRDANAWLYVPSLETPGFGFDYLTLYPDYKIVTWVQPNSPAEKAGLQVGDVIQKKNGEPPQPYDPDNLWAPCNTRPLDLSPQEELVVLRDGQELTITIERKTLGYGEYDPFLLPTGRKVGVNSGSVGYLELPSEYGSHTAYPGEVQKLMKELDSTAVCGWIIDLRRTYAGDIWSYIAAVGPILGEDNLGGFVYLDGERESWAYRKGDVFWSGSRRPESELGGEAYTPKQVTPVALLIGPGTQAASELLVVAFGGRADVRTFGEPTFGLPTLVTQNALRDGSSLVVSGAFSYDRNKTNYDGPITPDVSASTDWLHFGSAQDPAVQTAADWLSTQNACQP